MRHTTSIAAFLCSGYYVVVSAAQDGMGKGRWIRLALFAALTIAAVWAVRSTGMSGREMLDWTRNAMVEAGALGLLLFVMLFTIGELVHVPGVVFIAAAALAYGKLGGAVVGYLGALVSVSVAFFIVRSAGGQALATIDKPWMKRWLKRLEDKPIRAVVVLRTILWMAPALNYALAMTPIRFRDYAIGSAIGLLLPVTLAVAFLDTALAWFL